MALLPVVSIPDQRLRTKSTEVTVFDHQLATFMDDMVETMVKEDGCGLAANQVGVLHRALVFIDAYDREGDNTNILKIINPQIIDASDRQIGIEEGCLSVPGIHHKIDRKDEIRLKYQDETGEQFERVFSGISSIILQHEIDHINGILFIDHLPPLKKRLALERAMRYSKRNETQSKDTCQI